MKARDYILLHFILLSGYIFCQREPTSLKFWQLTSYTGQASIRANYRESEYRVNDFYNKQKDAYFNGILQLRTQSFFVHPNFMLVSLNAIYNPQTRRNSYVGVPDYTEKVNSEGLDISALFFKKKKINVTTNAIFNNSIQNIENITRIRTKTKQYGVNLSYNNKILPLTASYLQLKSDQQVIGSDRKFSLDQRVIQGGVTKSFTEYDHHGFSYYHTENKSTQSDSIGNAPQYYTALNTIDLFELTNEIAFDKQRDYTFNSNISNSDERGTLNFKRFQANEGLTLRLPKNLTFTGAYNYGQTLQDIYKVKYQGAQAALSHQLYKSLRSKIFYEHYQTNQTAYKDQRNRFGIDLLYTKKIYKGTLSLGYNFTREYQSVTTADTKLKVVHEEYTLTDNVVILLKKQNVDITSIVVRDITGSVIYQLNVDYILLDRSPYIEIIRIPGGLIANNASVYIDYTAIQGGTYKYYMNNHGFSSNVMLFDNKLNIYYRFSTQNYKNQANPENQILNYYTRHIVGFKLNFHIVKGGIEYEYYSSNLLPYQGMKYFLSFQKSYKRVSTSLNINLLDFQMTNEDSRRQDMDISAKVAYSITQNIKIDFDYMYRKMKGRGIDYDLQTAKLEITSIFHKLYVSVGSNLYWNQNANSNTLFKGVYAQLTRKF